MSTSLYSPIPLVNRMISAIVGCTTQDQVSAVARANARDFVLLAPMDLALVRGAALARRVTLALGASGLTFQDRTADAISDALVDMRASVAPSAPSVAMEQTTITSDLQTIATDSARMASVGARGTTRARGPQTRSQSPEQIARAVQMARAQGSRIAGYSGRVVEPATTGIGTVIQFGNAFKEYDPTSDRERQALIRWSSVENALVSAGFAPETLGKMVTNVAHLGQATKILNHSGYIARNVRNLGKARSSWIVGRVDTSVDSDTLGDRECRIDLGFDGSITLTDPDHAAALQVVREYESRIASTLIESSDLRARIERALVADFGARSTDLGLYVSPYHSTRAMDLIVALRPVAGRKIFAWAHTDAASISEALCDSFALDLARLEREIDSKGSDLKRIAGSSLIERIERLKAECAGLGAILGSDAVTAYRARLDAADGKVTSALDATAMRALQIELD